MDAYITRRDEIAAACMRLANGDYVIEYWDGKRCLISGREAYQNPVKVGVMQSKFGDTKQTTVEEEV